MSIEVGLIPDVVRHGYERLRFAGKANELCEFWSRRCTVRVRH